MEAGLDEFQQFIERIYRFNNIGIACEHTDTQLLIENAPLSYSVTIYIEELDTSVLITQYATGGAATHLSQYFAAQKYAAFSAFADFVIAFLRGFNPASACAFCSAHFRNFGPLPMDEHLRTLAVLYLTGKKLEDIHNMPLLDGVFSCKIPFLVSLQHPDAFIWLRRYNGPILGNGALRVGGNANFYDSEKQELKNLNELECVDGIWREKPRGYERNFMQFAAELDQEALYENCIVQFHETCKSQYILACQASEGLSTPVLTPQAAVLRLKARETYQLAKYGQRSQEMQRQGAAQMYYDYYQIQTQRSYPAPSVSKPGLAAPAVQMQFPGQRPPLSTASIPTATGYAGVANAQNYSQVQHAAAYAGTVAQKPTLVYFKAQIYQTQSFQQILHFDTIQTFRNYVNSFANAEQAVTEYERDCLAVSTAGSQIIYRVAHAYHTQYGQ